VKKRIVITMGDPAGIGPEVTLKALASPKIKGLADFFVIGDPSIIGETQRRLGLKLRCELIDLSNVPRGEFSFGVSRAIFGKASIEYLDTAVELITNKKADGLVTGPINKSSVRMAGFVDFQGHTEYLAALTGAKEVAMMFVGEKLKITLVTRHIALKSVADLLTSEAISRTIAVTHKGLTQLFGVRHPKIAVAGLNPHAGEGGAFGTEEAAIIVPAIRKASKIIKGIVGPLAPDVIFGDALEGKFDAVVAMYHDQGLIPFKMLYFKTGVNLTLGLPFIRTSPDHGTAFDIAGKGVADPSSMIEAIRLACRLSR